MITCLLTLAGCTHIKKENERNCSPPGIAISPIQKLAKPVDQNEFVLKTNGGENIPINKLSKQAQKLIKLSCEYALNFGCNETPLNICTKVIHDQIQKENKRFAIIVQDQNMTNNVTVFVVDCPLIYLLCAVSASGSGYLWIDNNGYFVITDRRSSMNKRHGAFISGLQP